MCPNTREIQWLRSTMLGPHLEHCTYRSLLTVLRTEKEWFWQFGPEKRRERTEAVLCWEQVQYLASRVQRESERKREGTRLL